MNAKISVLAIVAVSAGLAGCKPSEPTRSVEWFKQHRNEMGATIAACNNNPGELSATPNCINAVKAREDLTWNAKGRGVETKPLTFRPQGEG